MSIPKIKQRKSFETTSFKKFIDFDKNKQVFFDNMYIEEFKIVVKLPLVIGKYNKGDIPDMKVERFNLTNYTFLTSY